MENPPAQPSADRIKSVLFVALSALGGDWTWAEGAWRPTDPMMPRAGAGTLLGEPLREPRGNQVFAAVLGVLVLLPFSLWTLTALTSHPLEAAIQLAVALPLLALSLRSVVKKHTRRVCFDALGLCDADYIGARRVPWGAIKDMKQINLNARSQALYDRSKFKDREGSRPEDDMGAWDLSGEHGMVLLRLYKGMLPPDALRALRDRIQRQLQGGTDAFGFVSPAAAPAPRSATVDPFEQAVDDQIADALIVREGDRVLDPDNPADRKLIDEHTKAFSQFDLEMAKFEKSHKAAGRGMQAFMVLVVLGLLSGTAYLAFQSMWEEAMFLGGLSLFVGLLAWAVWWGTMRTAKPK